MTTKTDRESSPAAKYNAAERAAALDMNRTLGVGIGEPPYDAEVTTPKPPKQTWSEAEDCAANRLAPVLRALARSEQAELDRLRASQAVLDRDDAVWHLILQSFSTWGKSDGWHGLIGNRKNYARVTIEAISSYPSDRRIAEVERAMRDAEVRYPNNKARYLVENHHLFSEMGGARAVRDRLLAAPGRDGKIDFLLQFSGIGPKYARNILMDVYHPDFHDSIAIDSRLQRVTRKLGLSFKTYEVEEAFYVETGRRAGLNGWTVDRILYNFMKMVLDQLVW
jgi:hypothetical protein